MSIFQFLQDAILNEILLFDSHFVFREGKMVTINKIPKEDERRRMLLQRPMLIFNHRTGSSYVTLEINATREYVLRNDVLYLSRFIIKTDIYKDVYDYDYFEF